MKIYIAKNAVILIREEAWNLLKDDTDIDGSGGWDYDYLQEFINSNWDE